MSHWQKIRDAANNLRRNTCRAAGFAENELVPAMQMLDAAAGDLEIDLIPEHPDSNNLAAALAVLEDDCVYFNNHLKNWYKAFCIAHEIGHYSLHHQSVHCSREEIDDFEAGGDANSATEKVVGYGAGERREREANLFALEFLLPCAALKAAFRDRKMTAREIALMVEMPPDVVAGQLARALLVPVGRVEGNREKAEKSPPFELDESQKRAAEKAVCPTLVAAGPGTGKTQTLTRRVEYLIETGMDPKRILALTFSNRAAEEMRERVARSCGAERAAAVRIMTFHAFGLDILRAYWKEAGLDSHSDLIDKIDVLLYLEENLNFLDLEQYQMLHDPTGNLAAILGAISRAKDELCTAAQYKEFGCRMLAEADAAGDEEARIRAFKVLETARVYEFYEEYLRREKRLDFGDLIHRACLLLRENEAVRRELASRFDAVLVDEFQDVNRACGRLLKEICGDGKTLWAVGDLRQSIYRWRGASPVNINRFGEDFTGAEIVPLETNYRSLGGIVELFGHFSGTMKAGGGTDFFREWVAARDQVEGRAASETTPAVVFEVADSLEGEAARLAGHIRRARENGFAYKDCAVICRTHSQLAKFAEALVAAEIPIFYLGELFERDEVRDLLALLDLKVSTDGHSLIRVASFPEYKISTADVRKIINRQKENNKTFIEAMNDRDFVRSLSDKSRARLLKLAGCLGRLPADCSAWSLLANYLFSESRHLASRLEGDDVQNQSRRLAVYQFLRLAQSVEERFSRESSPVAAFLSYVKKLAYFNEDKNYAQIPAEAENLDAVRLLTVHSAKGLEFPIVFLPLLGAGKLPLRKHTETCPNPAGMIEEESDHHLEEEECLFFVAMSRARDRLHLSRSSRYDDKSSNESDFLKRLKDYLPLPVVLPETEKIEMPADLDEDDELRSFYARDLDRYLTCPRDYFYTNVLGLKAAGEKTIFLKFHGCVYDTLLSVQAMRRMENIELTETVALERLGDFWREAKVDEHPYAPLYRARAEEMVRRLFHRVNEQDKSISSPAFEVRIGNSSVRVRLDALEVNGDEAPKRAVIRKYKTGKRPKKVDPDNVEILMQVAAEQHYPGAETVVERVYLSDDTTAEVTITAQVIKNRLKKYEEAIDGIRRQKFEPRPKKECPRCPHFFICPSGDLEA